MVSKLVESPDVDDVLKNRTWEGLGPPDLCRLSRTETRLTGSTNISFHYHFVLGLDTLDSNSIISYMFGLIETAPSPRNSPLSIGARWKIDSGIYCCFDIFSQTDIRIVVKVPGGVSIRGITGDGRSVDTVPESVWQGAFLSSYVRSFHFFPGVVPLNTVPNYSSGAFTLAFEQILGHFIHQTDVSGRSGSSRFGTNLFVETFALMYLKRFQWKGGLELFASLQSLYPPIVVYMAEIYRLRGQRDAALSVCMRSLRSFPENDYILLFTAEIIDEPTLADSAIQLARSVGPANPWVWIRVAEIHRQKNNEAQMLLALVNALEMDVESPVVYTRVTHVEHPLLLGPGVGLAAWMDDESRESVIRSSSFAKHGGDYSLTKIEKAVYRCLFAANCREVSTCCSRLKKIFSVFFEDSTIHAEMEIDLTNRGNKSCLPMHSSPVWIRRVDACHRLEKSEYLEIACRMTLLHVFDLHAAKKLLNLWTNLGKSREAILVLAHIWRICCKNVPPPAKEYLPCHYTPTWLVNLVTKTAKRIGIGRLRNGVADSTLVVLDQLLTHLQGDFETTVLKTPRKQPPAQ